jgi:hypothetical protein
MITGVYLSNAKKERMEWREDISGGRERVLLLPDRKREVEIEQ